MPRISAWISSSFAIRSACSAWSRSRRSVRAFWAASFNCRRWLRASACSPICRNISIVAASSASMRAKISFESLMMWVDEIFPILPLHPNRHQPSTPAEVPIGTPMVFDRLQAIGKTPDRHRPATLRNESSQFQSESFHKWLQKLDSTGRISIICIPIYNLLDQCGRNIGPLRHCECTQSLCNFLILWGVNRFHDQTNQTARVYPI
jgi:hypothetical protein